MSKKILTILGIVFALATSTAAIFYFKREFGRREINIIAVREYFDVRSKGDKPIQAFKDVISASCRKASVEEIRKSKFARSGDLILTFVHFDGMKTTLEISELLRLQYEYSNTYGAKSDPNIREVNDRLNQFGVSYSSLLAADCSDWEKAISLSISH